MGRGGGRGGNRPALLYTGALAPVVQGVNYECGLTRAGVLYAAGPGYS
eukprot:COSAG01_NODE_6670_length_3554_cov_2.322431_1_plen_47_part_10